MDLKKRKYISPLSFLRSKRSKPPKLWALSTDDGYGASVTVFTDRQEALAQFDCAKKLAEENGMLVLFEEFEGKATFDLPAFDKPVS